MKVHLSTQAKINEVISFLLTLSPNGEYQATVEKLPKKRTGKQNASLWVYLGTIAQMLNESGAEMVVKIVGKEVHIPWTDKTLKAVVWDGIMLKMFNKSSSTELTTIEIQEVYEVMNRFTSDTFGVGVNWPCEVEV